MTKELEPPAVEAEVAQATPDRPFEQLPEEYKMFLTNQYQQLRKIDENANAWASALHEQLLSIEHSTKVTARIATFFLICSLIIAGLTFIGFVLSIDGNVEHLK